MKNLLEQRFAPKVFSRRILLTDEQVKKFLEKSKVKEEVSRIAGKEKVEERKKFLEKSEGDAGV